MRRLLTALSSLALLSGCGLLYAEMEIPSTTVVLRQQAFPGSAVGVPLVKDVTYHLGDQLTVLKEKDASYQLRLTRMEVALATTSAMGDFGDIASVTISVLPPPGQTQPAATVIASYLKAPPPADQNPTSITVAAMSNVDLAPYIVSGDLTLRFQAESITLGAIPPWTADVGAEFYLLVRVDYGKQM